MRVFVAGTSGAIGRRLVPQLLDRGHEVVDSTRSEKKARELRDLGAETVLLDVLDAQAVHEAFAANRPDAVVHEATALAGQVPSWLARRLAGNVVVAMMTESRGASNAKAKRELGWSLRFPTWRQGFVAAYTAAGALR